MNNSNQSNSHNNRWQDHPMDAFSSVPPSQRVRIIKNLPMSQRMTRNQLITFRNHGGRAASYDDISIFSLRPPELLYVFRNPVDYFRLCIIGHKVENNDKIEDLLSTNLKVCSWYDCLGRRIQLNNLGQGEVYKLVSQNMERIVNNESFEYEINFNIAEFITKYERRHEELPMETIEEIENIENIFISKSNGNLLPIPVLSDISPHNTIHFLIHVILSIGSYETEIDALNHPSFRSCLTCWINWE